LKTDCTFLHASYSYTPLLRVRRTPTLKNVSILFNGLPPPRVIWWTNKPVKFKNGRSSWVKIWMLSEFVIRCRYISAFSTRTKGFNSSFLLLWYLAGLNLTGRFEGI
jgi:hypothetical protein